MIPGPVSTRFEPHAEYRRRARRIRSVFRTQPGMRVRALRELARDHDAARIEPVADPVIPLPAGAAQAFARLVHERMDGPVLRYSHRTRLLNEAQRSGIGRFEANLIIAAVQHQRREARCEGEPVESRLTWKTVILGIGATQCAIVSALCWLIG